MLGVCVEVNDIAQLFVTGLVLGPLVVNSSGKTFLSN